MTKNDQCGKVNYVTKAGAEYYIDTLVMKQNNKSHKRLSKGTRKSGKLYVYKCPNCQYWHLTSNKQN